MSDFKQVCCQFHDAYAMTRVVLSLVNKNIMVHMIIITINQIRKIYHNSVVSASDMKS